MNTISQLSKYASQELKDSYPGYEIAAICEIICMDIFHFTKIDIQLRKNEILEQSFVNKFSAVVRRLKQGEPIQYILGETEFCGLRFYLDSSTLIPRPETAELVRWVETGLIPGQSLLDIGTGSGCIAVTLARNHPDLKVTGLDISAPALRTAGRNAQRHRTTVAFRQADILKYENYPWESYDVLVSNPPYIRESEKKDMAVQVAEHEPRQALFVPDNDPLLFYRRIAGFGQSHLHPDGRLYLEINEALGQETIQLLREHRYQEIELRQDFYGKDRMICAKKQG